MALPPQVLEQLGKEPSQSQGWPLGMLFFSGGLLALAIAMYLGITLVYDPYIQSKTTSTQNQLITLNNTISRTDETNLIDFYSQVSNLKILLQGHVLSSQFFSWLEKNTEANVYYQSLSLAGGYKVTATGYGTTEADVNQQVSIFENSPEVKSVSISNVSVAPTTGGWNFTLLLTMNPSLFLQSNP
jgi:hypothetical protein